MNLSGDYEKILEENIKDELEWLEQEFTFLFKQKQIKHCYTKDDISMGNQILDNVIGNIKETNSEQLLNLLAITLNRLEQAYPELF